MSKPDCVVLPENAAEHRDAMGECRKDLKEALEILNEEGGAAAYDFVFNSLVPSLLEARSLEEEEEDEDEDEDDEEEEKKPASKPAPKPAKTETREERKARNRAAAAAKRGGK